jgi:hypothetical protein
MGSTDECETGVRMSASRKTVSGRTLLLLALFFFLFGISIYRAKQYAHAAPGERTTYTYKASMQMRYHSYLFGLSKYYICSYDFMIEGASYSGLGPCPNRDADDSIKEKLSGSVRTMPMQNATVYYDPTNPSLNSLTEFNARSMAEYRGAMLPIGIGIIIIAFIVMGSMLEATKNIERDRIFIDAHGTVIYPEEIDSGSIFGRQYVESQNEEMHCAAANESNVGAASFASSLGLRELYLDVVKQIHPDHASSEADRVLRERLTKEANAAYERDDDETLRRVLEEYKSMNSAAC